MDYRKLAKLIVDLPSGLPLSLKRGGLYFLIAEQYYKNFNPSINQHKRMHNVWTKNFGNVRHLVEEGKKHNIISVLPHSNKFYHIRRILTISGSYLVPTTESDIFLLTPLGFQHYIYYNMIYCNVYAMFNENCVLPANNISYYKR